MKKNGFTLSELLVALGIIGVIAAITAPALSNLMPDKTKAQVLKLYKIITDANRDLLNDRGAYINYSDPTNTECVGFECTNAVANPEYVDSNDDPISGSSKYAKLMAHYKLDCTQISDIEEEVDFFTTDQMWWFFNGQTVGNDYNITITIDTNLPTFSPNCTYSNDCQNPDTFIFRVDPRTGVVTGIDPLTRAFLENPLKINDRRRDRERAAEIWTEENPVKEGDEPDPE